MATLFADNWDKICDKNFHSLHLLGSHDSCSYSVSENAYLYSDNKYLTAVNRIPKMLRRCLKISKLIHSFARSQQSQIIEQLNFGVRSLDVRICEHDNILYTNHSLLGMTVSQAIDQVAQFVEANSKEFVQIKFKWSDTNFPYDLSTKLSTLIASHKLKDKIILDSELNNNLSTLQASNKRVHLVMEGADRSLSSSNTIFCNRYIDTNDPNTKINRLKEQIAVFNPDIGWYDVQYVLTPQDDDVKKAIYKLRFSNDNLHEINLKLPKPTAVFICDNFNFKLCNILSLDFINAEHAELAKQLVLC